MRRFIIKFSLIAGMLIGLPLLGLVLAGRPVKVYLEFPPETSYVSHAPFSCVIFMLYALIALSLSTPIIVRWIQIRGQVKSYHRKLRSFPWWGRVGILSGLVSWFLAWTRFDWFSMLQPHTFIPLWISYILVINALTYQRDGCCTMTRRPMKFLSLFPASSVFWWFFEYLNRFVQNWNYTGVTFGPLEYFCYATISFSTVLPAVHGTYEWIRGFSWIDKGLAHLPAIRFSRPKAAAWTVVIVSALGLIAMAIWPNHFFPLVWLSPLLIIVAIQTLLGEKHTLSDIAIGDWRTPVSYSLAALLCGVFWEMWNYYSLAKWKYVIPYVHRYQIFEMPLLGYMGYLPFGLECSLIAKMIGLFENKR